MRKLSTHILDTAHGRPAAGVTLRLYRDNALLVETTTNPDGRTDAPLLAGDDLTPGTYKLEFDIAAYFRSQNHPDAGRFLTTVPLVFTIESTSSSGGGYHVPLLVSPWSYSTYRGS